MQSADFHVRKLAVFGVGLIGGSFALALKQVARVEHIVGVGRSQANLHRALDAGVIDEAADDARAAVRGADFVLIAVPVQQTGNALAAIAPHLAADCIVTDGGSTKRDVIEAARRALGERFPQFVPGHPIAGAEKSGVEAAHATLYRDRLVVLTPCAQTGRSAIERVSDAWRTCGARVLEMGAERHDEVFAAVSHLPHAVAFALVEMIAARPDARQLFAFAGAGFRDFTRIAGSSPEMWRDICLANRDPLLCEIAALGARLDALACLLRSGDGEALKVMFEAARTAREEWLQNRG